MPGHRDNRGTAKSGGKLINPLAANSVMRFFEGFFALIAVSAGMIVAAMSIVMHWLLQAAMLWSAGILIAIDIFAFLVWFVNWKYYPE